MSAVVRFFGPCALCCVLEVLGVSRSASRSVSWWRSLVVSFSSSHQMSVSSRFDLIGPSLGFSLVESP